MKLHRSVKRHSTRALALATAVLLGAVACSSPPSTSASTNPADLASASGEFSAWMALDGSQREAFEAYRVNAFKADNPNITPKISYRTLEQVDQQIQTALAAGKGPDLVITAGPSVAAGYANAGYLLPLDDYAAANGWADEFLPWALESGKVNGHLYSIPMSYETLVFFYNKTLFDKNGYGVPTTMAEFDALAAKMKQDNVIPLASGNAEFQGVSHWWGSMLINHGAGPDATYAALKGEKSFADPEFVEAATTVRDWFDKGWVQNSAEEYFTTQFGTLYEELASGKAGMYLSGSWEFPSLNNYFEASGQEYGWFPVPQWSEGRAYPIYEVGIGETLSISANSTNPDATAAYLNWQATDREAMMNYVIATNASPLPVKLTADDFPDTMNPLVTSHFQAISDATKAGNFGYLTWTFWPPQTLDYISTGFDKLISGGITPLEYMQNQADLFDKEFAAGVVPAPIPRTK